MEIFWEIANLNSVKIAEGLVRLKAAHAAIAVALEAANTATDGFT